MVINHVSDMGRLLLDHWILEEKLGGSEWSLRRLILLQMAS